MLDMDKQESMPRAGSSRRRQPAEKKSDQRPTQNDGGARSKSVKSDQRPTWSNSTRSNASKSDGGQKLKKEGKNLSYLHKDTSLSRSRRTSSVSRSGKSPSQSTRDDVQLYRPRPSPGSRDLGPALRVYNSSGSGSEMANGRSSSPMTARRASKCSVEGYPKLTVDDLPTGLEILSRQKVKHVEADERMQQINQRVIKVSDSLGGKSITENRLDCLNNRSIQVESYLEMIANRLCSELLHRIGIGLRKKYHMKHPLGEKERLNPKMIMSLMMTESLLWPVMSLRRQKRRLSLRKTMPPDFSTPSLSIKTSGSLMRPLSTM